MMRQIDFDYASCRPALGRPLLAVGALCMAISVFSYLKAADQAGEWETVAAKAAPRPKAVSAGNGDISRQQQEIEQANDVIRRLALPWGELFQAMENSAVDKVALLSVQPDSQQRMVSLNGEAQAYSDVLTYMVKLDKSGTLNKVRLVNHEIKRDDPQHPVAFTVTARWRIEP